MTVAITYERFVELLAGVNVAGVVRKYGHPPDALSTSDLPALWVQSPHSTEAPLVFRHGEGLPVARAQVVVAISAVGQSVNADNFKLALQTMDALADALRRTTGIGRGPLNWTIRPVVVEVAGNGYWAVVADVEGRL